MQRGVLSRQDGRGRQVDFGNVVTTGVALGDAGAEVGVVGDRTPGGVGTPELLSGTVKSRSIVGANAVAPYKWAS